MLQIADHGLVTELRMATNFFGRGMVWASAFYVDGVLVDAGPPRTAPALAEWLRNHPLKIAVNTHAHEDHVGGDYLLPVTPLAPSFHRLSQAEEVARVTLSLNCNGCNFLCPSWAGFPTAGFAHGGFPGAFLPIDPSGSQLGPDSPKGASPQRIRSDALEACFLACWQF